MPAYQVAYIPIGAPTFHLESAQEEFNKSKRCLSALSGSVVFPDKMLLTIPDLKVYLDTIAPQLIILQNITFANAAFADEILRRFSCPVVLWTLREPVIDGGRLRLNSLTGAYSAGNALHAFNQMRFTYVFGSPDEESVTKILGAAISAGKVRHQLRHAKLAAVGHTPQGFGFGRALDSEMLSAFGVTLESIEARELINRAKSYTDEESALFLAKAEKAIAGLKAAPERNLKDFARLYKAYAAYVEENGINALSSRCWPDFFTDYGTPVCAVLAMLNDEGVAASCESDVYGALSMYIGAQFTGKPTFFGDPVSLDEDENTITYWHCGTAASYLAREDTGAQAGVHPNRKIGPTLEFGCKPCEAVTVFRIGRKPDGSFRIFVLEGEALDKPKQFCGVSVVVRVKHSAKDIVAKSVKDGWEPHFVVVYGDVTRELEILGDMLGLEFCVY